MGPQGGAQGSPRALQRVPWGGPGSPRALLGPAGQGMGPHGPWPPCVVQRGPMRPPNGTPLGPHGVAHRRPLIKWDRHPQIRTDTGRFDGGRLALMGLRLSTPAGLRRTACAGDAAGLFIASSKLQKMRSRQAPRMLGHGFLTQLTKKKTCFGGPGSSPIDSL